MEWFDLAIRLVDVAAWPVVALVALLMFRGPLKDVIPLFKRLKYKDLELEFERGLHQVARKAEEVRVERAGPRTLEDQEFQSFILEEANSSPRTALIESWLGLEVTAAASAKKLRLVSEKKHIPFPQLVESLVSANVLSHEDAQLTYDLRRLRNLAVHEPLLSISKVEAEEFSRVAREIAEKIASETWKRAGGEWPSEPQKKKQEPNH